MDWLEVFLVACCLVPIGVVGIYAFILIGMKKKGYSGAAMIITIITTIILLIGLAATGVGSIMYRGNDDSLHEESIHFTSQYSKVASGSMNSGDRIEITFYSDEPVDIIVEWHIWPEDDYSETVIMNTREGETTYIIEADSTYEVSIRGSNDGEGRATIRVNFDRSPSRDFAILALEIGTACIIGSVMLAVWISKKGKQVIPISPIPEAVIPIPPIHHPTHTRNFPGYSNVPVGRIHQESTKTMDEKYED